MTSLPLWLTGNANCSYFADRQARSVVVDPNFALNSQLYSHLIEQGFRRSGDQVYRPYCDSCQACIPTRIAVNDFKPDRKQKRCLKRNAETQVTLKNAEFESAHFDLYVRYQAARHDQNAPAKITADDYIEFLGSTWCNTLFVEFKIQQQLAAVAVVDVLENAYSAVYTFFEPALADYSPGVYAVLWQIETARQLELDYVYLGFWIKNCRKMQYKNQYQPLQGLIQQQWQIITNQST